MFVYTIQPVVQPGLTTGWTNTCSFNTVVKPVCQPVVSCKRGFMVQCVYTSSTTFDGRFSSWAWVSRFCHPSLLGYGSLNYCGRDPLSICGMEFLMGCLSKFLLQSNVEFFTIKMIKKLVMWANAQRDGRSAECRWRPLFSAAVWLCSNAAKTRNSLKFVVVPQTNETIWAGSGPKFTIL